MGGQSFLPAIEWDQHVRVGWGLAAEWLHAPQEMRPLLVFLKDQKKSVFPPQHTVEGGDKGRRKGQKRMVELGAVTWTTPSKGSGLSGHHGRK